MRQLPIWYVDGKFVRSDKALMSVNDLGFLRGFAVFESMITYNGRVNHANLHIDRMFRSCITIGLKIDRTKKEIEKIILKTLSKNNFRESKIRMIATAGPTSDGITPSGKPSLFILVDEMKPDAENDNGFSLITFGENRSQPSVKTTNYLSAIVALGEARKRHADDALYVNDRDEILESTRGNFFAVKGDTIITAGDSVLLGVTRGILIRILAPRFKIEERKLRLGEIAEIDEAFLTSSKRGVKPVIKINDTVIGNGKPGEKTVMIRQLFRDYMYSINKS